MLPVLLRVRKVAHEPRHPLAVAAVELADVQRALSADEDPARCEVVRTEVHEGADGALLADLGGDLRLVDAVLEGDDEAVGCQTGSDRGKGRTGVLGLHGEEHGTETVRKLARRDGRHAGRELLDRALDREPVLVDGGDMLGVRVAEQHVVPVAGEPRADRPADGSGSHDDVLQLHCPTLIVQRCARLRERHERRAPAPRARLTAAAVGGGELGQPRARNAPFVTTLNVRPNHASQPPRAPAGIRAHSRKSASCFAGSPHTPGSRHRAGTRARRRAARSVAQSRVCATGSSISSFAAPAMQPTRCAPASPLQSDVRSRDD